MVLPLLDDGASMLPADPELNDEFVDDEAPEAVGDVDDLEVDLLDVVDDFALVLLEDAVPAACPA